MTSSTANVTTKQSWKRYNVRCYFNWWFFCIACNLSKSHVFGLMKVFRNCSYSKSNILVSNYLYLYFAIEYNWNESKKCFTCYCLHIDWWKHSIFETTTVVSTIFGTSMKNRFIFKFFMVMMLLCDTCIAYVSMYLLRFYSTLFTAASISTNFFSYSLVNFHHQINSSDCWPSKNSVESVLISI